MKNILKQLFIVLLCTVLVLNTCIATAYASELPDDEREELNDEFLDKVLDLGEKSMRTIYYFVPYILTQIGFVSNPSDLEQEYKNNDAFGKKLDSVWTKENIQIKTDSNGKKSLVFSKVVADTLISAMKDANKKPDNGGYELVKTVPVSKISRLYYNTNEEYSTIFNLLKDNNGMIGLYFYGGYAPCYYKVDASNIWIKGDFKYTGGDGKQHNFYTANAFKNLNSASTYYAYSLRASDVPAKNWNDTDNLFSRPGTGYNAYGFQLYDSFSYIVGEKRGVNPLVKGKFLVTNSGSTIPVFNTLDDAVAYSVANNLYYTTSDFTGVGQEVVIDYDELDKVLSGYYSGMYDMLQRLIAQNGGNALTPEQVQALADQVAESFDMLKTEINKGFEEQDKLIEKNTNVLKGIKNTLDDILKYVKKIRFWAAADTIIDGVDLVADLLKFIKDFLSDATVGVSVLVSSLSDTLNLVSKKFPFSIPWDIAFFVSNLAATPETPVFEVPLKLPSYGIDEKFVIDFSRFEIISKVSRSMLTMIYAMGLLKLTDKIINGKKGGAV